MSDMHRVDEAQPLLDPAFTDQSLNRTGDIEVAASIGNFEPKVLRQGFHHPMQAQATLPANAKLARIVETTAEGP